jgi:hypothetical protein
VRKHAGFSWFCAVGLTPQFGQPGAVESFPEWNRRIEVSRFVRKPLVERRPDLIAKAAVDNAFGRHEVFGME